jgi:hypothetical protein
MMPNGCVFLIAFKRAVIGWVRGVMCKKKKSTTIFSWFVPGRWKTFVAGASTA